jgi:hypothetical protein
MRSKLPVFIISCTATSTASQSSPSAAAAFCAAMKRASDAPLSVSWAIMAWFWRCVITNAVTPITTATTSAIAAAHFTRKGTTRGRLASRADSSISARTRPSASSSS